MNGRGIHFWLVGSLEPTAASDAVALPGPVSRAIIGRFLPAGGPVVHRDTLIGELSEGRRAKDPVDAPQVQMQEPRAILATRDLHRPLAQRYGTARPRATGYGPGSPTTPPYPPGFSGVLTGPGRHR